MIPWVLELHQNADGTGPLVDADTGGEPHITISNHANSSIVVSNALMTRMSLGVYEYDQTNDILGQSYDATWLLTYRGEPIPSPAVWNKTSTADSWYYSGRTGVQTLIDQTNISVVLDMNDDAVEDSGLMLADGIASDGYIDLFLANEGVTVAADPHVVNLTTAPAYVVQALADVSNHLVVWYGWHHRGLQESDGTRGKALAGIMEGYKEYADEQLEKIAGLLGETEGGFESIPVIDSSEQCTLDENGALVPPVGWWLP